MKDSAVRKAPVADAAPLRALGAWPVALAIVALGIAQQALGHFNGDNSWFITFAERVLDGARAYVDIGDPNPPLGFLVYMPAVFFARLSGVSAEAATVAEIFVCTFLSLAISGAILRRAGLVTAGEIGLWRNAALWVLLVAVGFGFAEREHFALIACLPLVAAYMARAEGRAVSLPMSLLAGVGGALALAFKPYYALPLAAGLLVACWRRRSLAPAFGAETLAMACGLAFYLALVWFAFPDYIAQVLPLAVEVYAPARNPFMAVLASPPFLFNLALLAAIVGAMWKIGVDWRAAILAAASAGFLATYVIQAKIWFNHAYPGIALAVLAALALALGRRVAAPEGAARFARLCLLPGLVCAPFFAAVTLNLPDAEEYPGLTAAIFAQGVARPAIAALAEQLDVGHPVVRRVGGRWVGRRNALWVNNCVRQILAVSRVDAATRDKLAGYAAAERTELAEDVAAGRPDLVLVESASLRTWAQGTPQLAHLLDGYARRGQAGDIEIWRRVASAGVN